MDKERDVFLLWHINPDNEDNAKMLGVYSTRDKAENAALSLKDKSGFKDHPESFEINIYRLDVTSWSEGFTTTEH